MAMPDFFRWNLSPRLPVKLSINQDNKMKVKQISFLILFFCLSSVYFFNHIGISSRVYGKAYDVDADEVPVYVLKSPNEAYFIWKKMGLRGRTIVNMSKYLHFIEADKIDFTPQSPVEKWDIAKAYEGRLDYKNFLWLAMYRNIAREIYHILPYDSYQGKRAIAIKTDKRAVILKNSVELNSYGLKRVLTSIFPSIKEPVLLNIDASYLENCEADEFVRNLKKSGLKVDLITFSLSKENPEVKEASRAKVSEIVRMLLG